MANELKKVEKFFEKEIAKNSIDVQEFKHGLFVDENNNLIKNLLDSLYLNQVNSVHLAGDLVALKTALGAVNIANATPVPSGANYGVPMRTVFQNFFTKIHDDKDINGFGNACAGMGVLDENAFAAGAVMLEDARVGDPDRCRELGLPTQVVTDNQAGDDGRQAYAQALYKKIISYYFNDEFKTEADGFAATILTGGYNNIIGSQTRLAGFFNVALCSYFRIILECVVKNIQNDPKFKVPTMISGALFKDAFPAVAVGKRMMTIRGDRDGVKSTLDANGEINIYNNRMAGVFKVSGNYYVTIRPAPVTAATVINAKRPWLNYNFEIGNKHEQMRSGVDSVSVYIPLSVKQYGNAKQDITLYKTANQHNVFFITPPPPREVGGSAPAPAPTAASRIYEFEATKEYEGKIYPTAVIIAWVTGDDEHKRLRDSVGAPGSPSGYKYKLETDGSVSAYKTDSAGKETPVGNFTSGFNRNVNNERDLIDEACEKFFGSKGHKDCDNVMFDVFYKTGYSLLLTLNKTLTEDSRIGDHMKAADVPIQYEILQALKWVGFPTANGMRMASIPEYITKLTADNKTEGDKINNYINGNNAVKEVLEEMIKRVNNDKAFLDARFNSLQKQSTGPALRRRMQLPRVATIVQNRLNLSAPYTMFNRFSPGLILSGGHVSLSENLKRNFQGFVEQLSNYGMSLDTKTSAHFNQKIESVEKSEEELDVIQQKINTYTKGLRELQKQGLQYPRGEISMETLDDFVKQYNEINKEIEKKTIVIDNGFNKIQFTMHELNKSKTPFVPSIKL